MIKLKYTYKSETPYVMYKLYDSPSVQKKFGELAVRSLFEY